MLFYSRVTLPVIRRARLEGKIYLHIMHIYAFAALTDIAAIVYNIGMRSTESPLKIGIT